MNYFETLEQKRNHVMFYSDKKVDKELIGGLKLQLGSFMIDTSIKNKLNKYKQKMLES